MPRYRYISTGPVVFTQEVVNGHTWAPIPGEEADFDHEIDHPFLQLVVPVENAEVKAPPVTDEAKDTAIDGDNLKES